MVDPWCVEDADLRSWQPHLVRPTAGYQDAHSLDRPKAVARASGSAAEGGEPKGQTRPNDDDTDSWLSAPANEGNQPSGSDDGQMNDLAHPGLLTKCREADA